MTDLHSHRIELMAPAGSAETLAAALNAGADAVYFGVGRLNMRARAASNSAEDDLADIVSRCHAAGAQAYLTVNTVIYDDEAAAVKALCGRAAAAGVDAVIAADFAAIQAARDAGLPLHISTQANVSNLAAVKAHATWADVVVLARELTLDQIKSIADGIRSEDIRGPSGDLVRIEAFVHGALCVAVSGHCWMSLSAYGHSANRGDCLQSCRRAYLVSDPETGTEFEIDNGFVMSPRDLCTIGCLDLLIDSGVEILKIEGRGRSADYVHETVQCYREALDSLLAGDYRKEQARIIGWRERLGRVFNRGFWEGGHYLGLKTEVWSGAAGSQATRRRIQLGVVTNYYARNGIAEIQAQSAVLTKGDEVQIVGPTTGCLTTTIGELRLDGAVVERVERAEGVTFAVNEKVRRGDKVFVLERR